MNVMELGAIGELVGGVAVIASLVYVGLQISHSTAVARAGSHQGFTESINQLNLSIVHDPVVADVWLRGCEKRSGLDPNECLRFDTLLHSILHVYETLFYQHQVGTVDRNLLAAEERSLAAMFATPGVQAWWAATPYSFPDEFRQHVSSIAPPDETLVREA